MSDGVHLALPFAFVDTAACREALAGLRLPQLDRLLARLAPVAAIEGTGEELSMPHEKVLAREQGLPATDGLIPLAALSLFHAGQDAQGAACAWITPCHWRMGQGHVDMAPPQELQLHEQASRTLLDAMQPYFAQDGIALAYESPTRWLARGELFRDVPCASLDRVAGRTLDPWMPRGDHARPLRRLQQEMQMLLYTHPLNDERTREGLLPVNSFWVSGTGALGSAPADANPIDWRGEWREAAVRGDWSAWAAAWKQFDAAECPRLAALLDAGQDVKMTLAGERSARTWGRAGGGLLGRITRAWQRPPAVRELEKL